jgi:hypothetical protein
VLHEYLNVSILKTGRSARAIRHDEALAFEGVIIHGRMKCDEERLEPKKQRALGWIESLPMKMANENHAHSIDASVVETDLLERETNEDHMRSGR